MDILDIILASKKSGCSQISQKLAKKMQYYKVTTNGSQILHDGTAMTYDDVKEKFDDPSIFIYLEYQNLVYIPSIDVPNLGLNAIAFSSAWTRSDEAADGQKYDMPYISRVIINSDNVVKSTQIQLESTENRVTDVSDYGEMNDELYPTVGAVRDGLNNKIDKRYGAQYAGYALVVGEDGNVYAGDIISTSKVAITSQAENGHVTFSFIETQ